MKRRGALVLILIAAFAVCAGAQTYSGWPRVYIEPMDNGFDRFMTAALFEKKVPVRIVKNEADADFIISGNSAHRGGRRPERYGPYGGIYGPYPRDVSEGSIEVLRKNDQTIAWAGSAGDEPGFFDSWRHSGQKRVAERLADKLKKEVFRR